MKEMIAQYLFNDEMKAKVVKELNENINIPIINEKTEGKIIEAIYETVEACVKKASSSKYTHAFKESCSAWYLSIIDLATSVAEMFLLFISSNISVAVRLYKSIIPPIQ